MKRTRKRKINLINKRSIFILICLIMLVIFEIIAFRNSKANKLVEITASIKDYDSKLETTQLNLTAANSGASGYYLILPEYINNKKVSEFFIESKNMHTINENQEEQSTEENLIEDNNQEELNATEDEQQAIQEQEGEVSKLPKETIYLTDEEVENKTINLSVRYSTCENEGQLLYEQIIQTQVDNDGDGNYDNTIKAEGFMPNNSKIAASLVNTEEMPPSIEEKITEKMTLKIAYDIKIISDGKEYEPYEFDKDIKISISGMEEINSDTQRYKVLHIENQNTIEEIKAVDVSKNTVTFNVNGFSTYAVLLEDNVSKASILSAKMQYALEWDGTVASKFRFGSGTKEDPYLIVNGDEFAYLSKSVNNGNSYEGKYFYLINDIDLNNNTWTPIGNHSNSFKGVFDGLGHTIGNGKINLPSSLPTTVESYGMFGSIGGGSSYSCIKNLQLDNITIKINATGETASNTNAKGYNIGIVTGTMFKNSQIKNVIVNNGEISIKSIIILTSNRITLNNNSSQAFIGGIAGYATNSATSDSDPGESSRYKIENCYSTTDIRTNFYPKQNKKVNAAQHGVGGIIGGIRNQPVWPQNCLYKGTITSEYAFVGPVFGQVRGGSSVSNTNKFSTVWNGYDAGNASMIANSYFYDYTANNNSFSTSVKSGTSSETRDSFFALMKEVQGVNKGLYLDSLDTMLNNFNNYVSNSKTEHFLTWNLTAGTDLFSFTPEIKLTDKEEKLKHTILVNGQENSQDYKYKWYIDGQLDTSRTQNNISPNWEKAFKAEVIVSNENAVALYTIANIHKYKLDVEFNQNTAQGILTANIVGTGTNDPNFNLEDYTFRWEAEDISSDEPIVREGNTTDFMTIEFSKNNIYTFTATNNKYPYMSVEGYYGGNRTVIFVDYNNGSDSNDGFTPQTAVKTFATAYGKFGKNRSREENIIVLMGNYTNIEYLNSEYNSTYQKDVTITGKYKGKDYNAVLAFQAANTYRYLNGNTTFMHLTFDGNSNNTSDTNCGQTYFFLQGYSLTMGESIVMKNYKNAESYEGLIKTENTNSVNAPAFHILGGWLKYNNSSLPRNNAKILIKSGTYARIILRR